MEHNIYLYILVVAGVTYLIRVLPLTLIRREIKNTFLRSFLYYVPYVTLAAMTFPAILHATDSIWSGLAGFVGMKIATSANARTANAAHDNIFILSPSIKKYLSYVRISLVCLSYTYFSQ